jgi:hypothetical protein
LEILAGGIEPAVCGTTTSDVIIGSRGSREREREERGVGGAGREETVHAAISSSH